MSGRKAATYGRRVPSRPVLPARNENAPEDVAWRAAVSAKSGGTKRAAEQRVSPRAKKSIADIAAVLAAEQSAPSAAESTSETRSSPNARLTAAAAAAQSPRHAPLTGRRSLRSPYPKSRKSDIRPRVSVSPTDAEYGELLRLCGLGAALPFETWLSSACVAGGAAPIAKIGESSFSEVFRVGDGDAARAIKIMPLLRPDARADAGSGRLSAAVGAYHSPEPVQLEHLLREVRALRALDDLRAARRYAVPSGHTGFNRLRACAVIRGAYPAALVDAWDAWGAVRANAAENDRPDHYGPDALHVALVMDFGGTDLEAYSGVRTCAHVRSIMLQLLAALALAEREVRFEHRDLHLGNVLVRPAHRDDVRLENYMTIATAGLLVSVIDCSLSRFEDAAGAVTWRDLRRDGWLFTGSAEVSRQYQLYRDMQAAAGDDWRGYWPATNALWIAYIVEELLARNARVLRRESAAHDALQRCAALIASSPDCTEALRRVMKEQ